jgi:diguanylate cyclase (GGDEF)-like protein
MIFNKWRKQRARIKSLESENERLKELVYKDELTSVFNRRGFSEEVERIKTIESQKQQQNRRRSKLSVTSLALIFIDLDNFKKINDHHGHEVGDEVLKRVGSLLTHAVRPSDIVGRWGGEEFLVALPGEDEEGAYLAAQHVRDSLRKEKVLAAGRTVPLSASIGVAELNAAPAPFQDLVARADAAMYRAKSNGKDQVVKATQI